MRKKPSVDIFPPIKHGPFWPVAFFSYEKGGQLMLYQLFILIHNERRNGEENLKEKEDKEKGGGRTYLIKNLIKILGVFCACFH